MLQEILLEYSRTPCGIFNMAHNFIESANAMLDFIRTVRSDEFKYQHILYRLLDTRNRTIPDFHQHLVKEKGLNLSDNVVRKWFDPNGEKSGTRTPDLDIVECFANFIELNEKEKLELLIVTKIKKSRKDTKDNRVLVSLLDYLDEVKR